MRKKKIRDLTKYEVQEICVGAKSCPSCPLKKMCEPQDVIKLLQDDEFFVVMNSEVEIDE